MPLPHHKKKAELTKRYQSFGSPAVSIAEDPPLSVPASRQVWLFQGYIVGSCFPGKFTDIN